MLVSSKDHIRHGQWTTVIIHLFDYFVHHGAKFELHLQTMKTRGKKKKNNPWFIQFSSSLKRDCSAFSVKRRSQDTWICALSPPLQSHFIFYSTELDTQYDTSLQRLHDSRTILIAILSDSFVWSFQSRKWKLVRHMCTTLKMNIDKDDFSRLLWSHQNKAR